MREVAAETCDAPPSLTVRARDATEALQSVRRLRYRLVITRFVPAMPCIVSTTPALPTATRVSAWRDTEADDDVPRARSRDVDSVTLPPRGSGEHSSAMRGVVASPVAVRGRVDVSEDSRGGVTCVP